MVNTRIHVDRQGRPYRVLRNRGIGSTRYYLPLTPRCHICFTSEADLVECPHCGYLACADHYDYHLQVCQDCAIFYQHLHDQHDGEEINE